MTNLLYDFTYGLDSYTGKKDLWVRSVSVAVYLINEFRYSARKEKRTSFLNQSACLFGCFRF